MKAKEKSSLQDQEYEFPYHHLPTLEKGGIKLYRGLKWGLDYLSYIHFVKKKILEIKPERLLDIGCGDGRLISEIKEEVEIVEGVDISRRAIDFARAFNPGIKFYCKDFRQIDKKYNLVVLMETLEHISNSDIPKFVESIARKLHKNGKLILTVPSKNKPLIPKHYRHYDLNTIKNQLSSNFKIIEYYFLNKVNLLKIFKNFLWNSFIIIDLSLYQHWIWKIWKKYGYKATPSSGARIVVIAEMK